MTISDSNKKMFASYGRTFLATVLTLILAGETDLKSLLMAGIAATAGPIIRALNPKDPAFGVEIHASVTKKKTKKSTKKS